MQADGTLKDYENENLRFSSNSELYNTSEELKKERTDRTDVFFTSTELRKYTPRSILIDLEPSVISRATAALPMFNPRNIHLSENGSGAANNWQRGYHYATEHEDELFNLLDRELDKCDNLSAFQLFHSVAGGTGSGVGSFLLQLLNDRYGSKKIVSTFLIFPSNEKTSDVVVQPYNTVLTLKRLIEFSDATFVFNNDSLNSLESTLLAPIDDGKLSSETAFGGANKLISHVAAGISNPLRFPSYMYSSYQSIIATLVPTPDLKFLSSSIAPFSSLPGMTPKHDYVNLNENDIILELLNDKYKMNHVEGQPQYLSMMDYLIGDTLNQHEIRKGLIRAQQRVQFVPWTSSSIHVVNGKKLPFIKSNSLNGFQISNNTSIPKMFAKIVRQYDLLAKRQAYINFYTETNDASEREGVLEAFEECKESILGVIDEYKSSTSMSYLEDVVPDDDDDIMS